MAQLSFILSQITSLTDRQTDISQQSVNATFTANDTFGPMVILMPAISSNNDKIDDNHSNSNITIIIKQY